MTDAEIMKAFECCYGSEPCYKTGCPLFKDLNCNKTLHKAMADLINRQKAEIDELKLICDKEKADRLYLVQANEALIAGQETLQRALSDEIAKNEELRNQDMVVFRGSRGCGKTQFVAEKIRGSINRIRAEAIKEFAERLKEHSSSIQIGNKYDSRIVTIDGIDYLVKEMVGEG